jgi:nucleoid-associated protein YgaU
MTTDAKVGLLLGLVFIFLIAFIINGLPSFDSDENNNELTANMVSMNNNPPGIGTVERKVSRQVINPPQPVRTEPPITQTRQDNDAVRFETQLPDTASPETESTQAKPTHARVPVGSEEKPAEIPRTGQRTKSAFYVVRDGESLAAIALKLYGPEEGNKTANIDRIYQTNHKLLKSPDQIYPGQKLIIPALPVSPPHKSSMEKVFSTAMFEKVKSVGRRHSSPTPAKNRDTSRYIVQDGDSLWHIAAQQLGDSSRYDEIVELNTDILEDEDSLSVGICLKLPPR